MGEIGGLALSTRRRGKPAFTDLVEQGLVADLEDSRGFGAIPAHALEHLGQSLALGLSGAAARDLPEALGDQWPRSLDGSVQTAIDQRFDSLLTVGEHDQPLDRVLELAHVARPRIFAQAGQRLGRELLLPPVLRVELGEEPRREPRNLLAPLPQRRHADLDHVEPVVEVFPELTTSHRLFEVPISRGDHARIDVDHSVPADAREPEILQHVEELRLQRVRKLGDLVEVDRPFVRVLELARLATMRAREGALLVAEELGLEQPLGNGGAVDLDEGPLAARGGHMDGAGDAVLAPTALTSDPDGQCRRGQAIATRAHALPSLARERPDAVVLDVRLPTLNGVGVLRQIRSTDPNLPVIIMTGLATQGELAEIRRLGVTEIVEKPEVLKHFGDALGRIARPNTPPAAT